MGSISRFNDFNLNKETDNTYLTTDEILPNKRFRNLLKQESILEEDNNIE